MFAAIPSPPPGTTEPWLWNLMVVVGIVTGIVVMIAAMRKAFGRRPPIEEELKNFVGIHRVEQLEGKLHNLEVRVEALRQEWKVDIHNLNASGENRAAKLHEKVDEVLKAAWELRGRVQRRQH